MLSVSSNRSLGLLKPGSGCERLCRTSAYAPRKGWKLKTSRIAGGNGRRTKHNYEKIVYADSLFG